MDEQHIEWLMDDSRRELRSARTHLSVGPIYRKEHILSISTIAIMLYSMLLRWDWVGLVSELKGTRVSK